MNLGLYVCIHTRSVWLPPEAHSVCSGVEAVHRPDTRRAARDAEALSRNPAIRISNRDLAAIVQTSCLQRHKGVSDHSCPTAVADQCELPRAGCTVRNNQCLLSPAHP
jgi:hypothetical protein